MSKQTWQFWALVLWIGAWEAPSGSWQAWIHIALFVICVGASIISNPPQEVSK